MAELGEYRRKRRSGQTPEPATAEPPPAETEPATRGAATPRARRGAKQPIFVVQRHDASRLHYDFRLERNGALASWAVPKGVPLEPGEQRLAVHVEDHPLEYATFEGTIPKGNYGAGTVELWDKGTYELIDEKPNGELIVRLHGTKLDGLWALIPAKLSGDAKNWLLVRMRERPETDDASTSGKAEPDARDADGAGRPRKAYRPMLATLADEIPRGEGWLFEVKWDGYRALGTVTGGEARLVSRNGNDVTGRFPSVAKALARAVRTPDCVVDGEVCALDDSGKPRFSAMQRGTGTLVYVAFDLLELDGRPLTELPFAERHRRLAQLLDRTNPTVKLSETFDDGDALLEAAAAQGLEGVIAKRADSPYVEGRRTRTWLKVKTHHRQEFVICGYTRGQGRRAGRFGALILGMYRGDELVYVGNCGTGFSEADIDRLYKQLRKLERPDPPFTAGWPKMAKVKKADVVWVQPRLVCEVEFAEWTHDGRLRAPSFQGLRDDKEPEEVHREKPTELVEKIRGHELKLTNLDKLFWPDEGITKGDLIDYYRSVASVLVAHLRDRPFTMKRYPDGWNGKFFFQKDAPKHMPTWIPTARFEVSPRDGTRERREIDFPIVNDEAALLWMVNMGCIDMNAWYSRIDKPDKPDFVLFDLDPSDDVGFAETIEVTLLVKEALDALGLESFAKTSGSEGMHVLVPVERRHSYDETRTFADIVARALASAHPGLVTTEWTKAKRRGVLIDVNQNGRGKTIASVYSVRPKPGAPVSTALRWSEVAPGLDPAAFTMAAVRDRVERHGDLFAGVLTTKQRLGPALRSLGA